MRASGPRSRPSGYPFASLKLGYNAAMAAVFKLLFGICLLRSGPESVPTQTWFLGTLVAANLALAMFMFGAVEPRLSVALGFNVALIGVTTTAGLTWFTLYVRHLESRFPATLGAMLGTQLVIGAVMWLTVNLVGTVLGGATIVFLIWSIVVAGFVLHRALSCKLWLGILLALGIRTVGDIITMAVLGTAITSAVGVP